MKITTFNPQVFTGDLDPVVQLFEALGFQRRHRKEGVGDLDVTAVRMEDGSGFPLDISQNDRMGGKDMVGIRINVDDFDEAYRFFQSKGFRNVYGDDHVALRDSKSAVLISPTGFGINLVEHIKK